MAIRIMPALAMFQLPLLVLAGTLRYRVLGTLACCRKVQLKRRLGSFTILYLVYARKYSHQEVLREPYSSSSDMTGILPPRVFYFHR